jgi:3-isopropylmalate dehydrogenase
MDYKIAVLAGDGIGPEIIEQAKKVVTAIGKKFNHSFNYTHALVGAVAIDKTGNPLPAETLQLCKESDAFYSVQSATQNMIITPQQRCVPSRDFWQ